MTGASARGRWFQLVWWWPFRFERTENGDPALVWQGWTWEWAWRPRTPPGAWVTCYRWTLHLGPLEIRRWAQPRGTPRRTDAP
jgi:hypothetical protein